MIKQLTKLANHLDSKGLRREADCLDAVIRKIAAGGPLDDGVLTGTELIGIGEEMIQNEEGGSVPPEKASAMQIEYVSGYNEYDQTEWTVKINDKEFVLMRGRYFDSDEPSLQP